MNQRATSWLQRITFLSIVILVAVSSVARISPALAQVVPANFDAVDDYISGRMKDLGIPSVALVIVYVLLVALPLPFEANISTVILFQPDVGWVAVVSGVFAVVWGIVSTSIGISMLRQTVKRPEMVQRPYL